MVVLVHFSRSQCVYAMLHSHCLVNWFPQWNTHPKCIWSILNALYVWYNDMAWFPLFSAAVALKLHIIFCAAITPPSTCLLVGVLVFLCRFSEESNGNRAFKSVEGKIIFAEEWEERYPCLIAVPSNFYIKLCLLTSKLKRQAIS